MDTFSEVGERAMKALVEAIRDELVCQKQVHVDGLGTFRIIEEPTQCTHNAQETTVTPPTRQIIFEAHCPSAESDG